MLLRFPLLEFPVQHCKVSCPEYFLSGKIDMAYNRMDIPLGQKLKVCFLGRVIWNMACAWSSLMLALILSTNSVIIVMFGGLVYDNI